MPPGAGRGALTGAWGPFASALGSWGGGGMGGGAQEGSPAQADSHSSVEAATGRVVETSDHSVQDEGHKLKPKGRGKKEVNSRREAGQPGDGRREPHRAGLRPPHADLLHNPTNQRHSLENPENWPRGSATRSSSPGRQGPGEQSRTVPSEESWEAGRTGRAEGGTWRCKFWIRQVTPKATSRMLVRVKALMALVSFWILR